MDELQQLLLARMTGNPGLATASLSLPDLLEQAMGDDPLAEPLAAALRSREANQAASAEEAVDDGSHRSDDPVVADVMRRLYDELEILRARNALLADALGACPRCWGEDRSCPVCRGRGVTGGRSPDPDLFESVVQPAIRRHRADRGRGPEAGSYPSVNVNRE